MNLAGKPGRISSAPKHESVRRRFSVVFRRFSLGSHWYCAGFIWSGDAMPIAGGSIRDSSQRNLEGESVVRQLRGCAANWCGQAKMVPPIELLGRLECSRWILQEMEGLCR